MTNIIKIIMFVARNWSTISRIVEEIMEILDVSPQDTKTLRSQAKKISKEAKKDPRKNVATLNYFDGLRRRVKL